MIMIVFVFCVVVIVKLLFVINCDSDNWQLATDSHQYRLPIATGHWPPIAYILSISDRLISYQLSKVHPTMHASGGEVHECT